MDWLEICFLSFLSEINEIMMTVVIIATEVVIVATIAAMHWSYSES
jgi:hypothetical protein